MNMELTKEIMLPFLLSHKDMVVAKQEREWTFEFPKLSAQSFDTVWANLRSRRALKDTFQNHEECLHVIAEEGDHSGMILRVCGVPNITRYCAYETCECVPHEWEQKILIAKEIVPDELPLKVSSTVVERRAVSLDAIPARWTETPKYYSLEKRFSYHTDDFEYSLRLVRRSNEPATHMKDSGVTTNPISYEVSMRCKEQTTDVVDIMEGLMTLLQCVHNDYTLINKAQIDEILHGYDALVRTKLETGRRRGRGDSQETPNEYFFFAPKPVTLEKPHISDPSMGYGVTTIQTGYCVTDKADGERLLMYIHDDGHAYLINNTFDVRVIGVQAKSPKMYSSLIDGEYIPSAKRRDGDTSDLFMAFDVYYIGGESIMNLPLIADDDTKPSRYKKMAELIDSDMWKVGDDSYIEIDYKRHVAAEGDDMFAACDKILKMSDSFRYDIDGLIFTPRYLPVFGYYPNKPVRITENVRWDRVLKWKPAEQNTIDFLVELRDPERVRVDPLTRTLYGVLALYTGYNATQWEAITVMEGLRMRYDREYNERIRSMGDTYRAKTFHPISYYERGVEEAHVALVDGSIRAENGDVISDKTIVEFAYDPNPNVHVSKRWIPLRVREDKTRIFQRTGKLSKTANDLSVAMSIWRTIHNPVTTEMISGVRRTRPGDVPDMLEERLLGVDDTYYAREIPRQHMLSVHMLNFHNQGIKKMLYQKAVARESLLELACGMAGDLPRWRDSAYRFVLGVDLVRDNIVHPREGSYARVQKQRRAVTTIVAGVEKVIYPDIVFAIGDCALPLHDGSAAEGIDDDSKKLLRILFKTGHQSGIAPYMKYVVGRAARGFDTVSCQFATHYFFQSPEKLNGFLGNVSRNLKKGGVFIATFMDGDKVEELLRSAPNGVAEGKKLDGTVTVWAIIRKFTVDATDPFGRLVDVYLENTNKLIPEFLVKLDTLIEHANAHGLELAETEMFSETFARLRATIKDGDESKYTQLDQDILALDADDVQKRFSFLNRWVVFKKV
jgi:SAM-dependent methyltransferase